MIIEIENNRPQPPKRGLSVLNTIPAAAGIGLMAFDSGAAAVNSVTQKNLDVVANHLSLAFLPDLGIAYGGMNYALSSHRDTLSSRLSRGISAVEITASIASRFMMTSGNPELFAQGAVISLGTILVEMIHMPTWYLINKFLNKKDINTEYDR